MMRSPREQKIIDTLEGLKPFIRADGGDITYLRLEGDIVYVKLSGACRTCPLSSHTLNLGVKQALQLADVGVADVVVAE